MATLDSGVIGTNAGATTVPASTSITAPRMNTSATNTTGGAYVSQQLIDDVVATLDPSAATAAEFGVIVADRDQVITHVNDAFTALTGYGRSESIGRRPDFLQGPATSSDAIKALRGALRSGLGCRVRILNYRKDGEPFWMQLTIAPCIDTQGQISRWVGIQMSVPSSTSQALSSMKIYPSLSTSHSNGDDSDDEYHTKRVVAHGSLASRRKISSSIIVTATPISSHIIHESPSSSSPSNDSSSPAPSSSSHQSPASLPTSSSTGSISSLASSTSSPNGVFVPISPCSACNNDDDGHHQHSTTTTATLHDNKPLVIPASNGGIIPTINSNATILLPPTTSSTIIQRDDAKAELKREEEEVKIIDSNGNVTMIKRLKILPKSTTTRFVAETLLPTTLGKYRVRAYTDSSKAGGNADIIAMIWGQPEGQENVVLRVHDQCFTSEVLGSLKCDCREQLDFAKEYIQSNASGSGIIIYMPQEGRGIGLANKIAAYHLQESGYDTVDANRALGFPDDLREYSAVPSILDDLKISSVRLMTNNPRKIDTLTAYGIHVTERLPVLIPSNQYSNDYLVVKRSRMGHLSH